MLRRNIYYRPLMSFLFARLQPFADIDMGEFSRGVQSQMHTGGVMGLYTLF